MSFGSTRPVARKKHLCQECWRDIRPGETYHRNEQPDADGVGTWKGCEQCSSLCRDLFAMGIYGENEWGQECYPTLQDVYWDEVPNDELWTARQTGWRAQWKSPDGSLIPYPIAPLVIPALAPAATP